MASQRPHVLVALCLSVQWSTQHCTVLGKEHGIRGAVEQRSSATSHVYYVTDVADRFLDFASGHRSAADSFHTSEQERLQTAIRNAGSQRDKAFLEEAAVRNEEARLEAEQAFNEMQKFVTTLKEAMGTSGQAESCQFLSCGEHAYCSSTSEKAECHCEAGYEGNGFICKPPRHPLEQPLFAQTSPSPRIADLHVSTLRNNHVAVVYRDITKQHRGYLMFGKADLAGMVWKAPLPFSNKSQAFGPVVVELQGPKSGVAIAFRDANRGGTASLLGGACDPEQNLADFGPARAFARYQAQGMSLVALPESLVAVVFAEHTMNRLTGAPEAGAMYGSAVLAKVGANGAAPEVISKRRFATGPVARIATSMLSPSSFVVAFRQADDSAKGERAEASCMSARVHGGELIFDPRPLLLEPQRGQIWSRSLATLGEGVVAYTYHSGVEQVTKQALLSIDPRTEQLGLLRAPAVISEGFTPYVGSVSTSTPLVQHLSLAQAERLRVQGPRVLTYFSGGSSITPKGRFCRPDREHLPSNCQDVTWANHEVTSAAGIQVGDGRLLFVSTDASQSGFYSMVGAMEPF